MVNEQVAKWLENTKNIPKEIVDMYYNGTLREISEDDAGRMGLEAAYIGFYVNNSKRYYTKVYYVNVDIGDVNKTFADVWIRHIPDPQQAPKALTRRTMKASRHTGRLLIFKE